MSGIVGDGQMVYGILRHILIQLAAYHSYDEVKLVFLCDESRLGEFGYVRFLPHIWDNDHRERFLATNPEEVQNLSAGFTRIIEKRRQEKAEACPHYVVISVSISTRPSSNISLETKYNSTFSLNFKLAL